MNVDHEKAEITIRGKVYNIEDFKGWFKSNYQPLLGKYHIAKGVFDWHSIMLDVQKNGIIEIFENEMNGKSKSA